MNTSLRLETYLAERVIDFASDPSATKEIRPMAVVAVLQFFEGIVPIKSLLSIWQAAISNVFGVIISPGYAHCGLSHWAGFRTKIELVYRSCLVRCSCWRDYSNSEQYEARYQQNNTKSHTPTSLRFHGAFLFLPDIRGQK